MYMYILHVVSCCGIHVCLYATCFLINCGIMPPFEEAGDSYFLHVGPSVRLSAVVVVKLLPIGNLRMLGPPVFKFDR